MKKLLYVCLFILLVSCGKKGGGSGGSDAASADLIIDELDGGIYLTVIQEEDGVAVGYTATFNDGYASIQLFLYDYGTQNSKYWYYQVTHGTYTYKDGILKIDVEHDTCITHVKPYEAELYGDDFEFGFFMAWVPDTFDGYEKVGNVDDPTDPDPYLHVVEDTSCVWQDFVDSI